MRGCELTHRTVIYCRDWFALSDLPAIRMQLEVALRQAEKALGANSRIVDTA